MVLLEFQDISEQAYNLLLEMIINQKLKFGQRLIEERLATKLRISRTPLRKAVNRLAKEGFIDIEPRKGARIKQFNIKDVTEVYDIRSTLEGLAVKLAAGQIPLGKLENLKTLFASKDNKTLVKADTNLHNLILEYCNNNRLVEILGDLKNLIQVFRVAGYASRKRSQEATVEHIKIVDALMKRKAQQAEKLMMMHIEKTKMAISDGCKSCERQAK